MLFILLSLAACRHRSRRWGHRNARHRRHSDKNFLGMMASVMTGGMASASSTAAAHITAQSQSEQLRQQLLQKQSAAAAQSMQQSKTQMDQMFATLDQRTAVKLPKRPGVEETPKEIAPVTLEKIEIDRNDDIEDQLLRLLKQIV